jgi:methyltransferase family protein
MSILASLARRLGWRSSTRPSKARSRLAPATAPVAPPVAAPTPPRPAPDVGSPRHDALAALHRLLRPRTYLEIGVNDGRSLALSRSPSIGVDPAFRVTAEIRTDVHLVKATSDDFFARPDPLAHLRGRDGSTAGDAGRDPTVDLAFIDGMHLFEFALRDFMNVERYTTPASVIVLDDVFPRTVEEAARHRTTGPWAGDVYKVVEVLRQYRPDLVVVTVDSQPTGLAIVLGPDAASTALATHYDEILVANVVDDPQPVPDAVLRRRGAVDPEAVLENGVWAALVDARGPGASRDRVAAILAGEIAPLLDAAAGREPAAMAAD